MGRWCRKREERRKMGERLANRMVSGSCVFLSQRPKAKGRKKKKCE